MTVTDPHGVIGRRCSDCLWYAKQQDYDGGQCWRYPPTPTFQAALDGSGAIHFENLRPYVSATEGCGEFQENGP